VLHNNNKYMCEYCPPFLFRVENDFFFKHLDPSKIRPKKKTKKSLQTVYKQLKNTSYLKIGREVQ